MTPYSASTGDRPVSKAARTGNLSGNEGVNLHSAFASAKTSGMTSTANHNEKYRSANSCVLAMFDHSHNRMKYNGGRRSDCATKATTEGISCQAKILTVACSS